MKEYINRKPTLFTRNRKKTQESFSDITMPSNDIVLKLPSSKFDKKFLVALEKPLLPQQPQNFECNFSAESESDEEDLVRLHL